MAIAEKILLVDDEVNILNSLKRHFYKKFKVKSATSGAEAIEMLKANDEFAVIISDMNMPGMNGAEFLAQAKIIRPNTVRVMLTGNADNKTPVDAINQGDVFRFHNKPCNPETLEKTIHDAMAQYRLIMAEKELLEGTLTGSIQILSELLSMINPEAFGRTSQLKQYVLDIGRELKIKEMWKLEVMASLSLIGCILLPDEATKKISLGQMLNEEEQQLFDMHPTVGAELINKIPRMQAISNSIKYQEKRFDGSGHPIDNVKGKDIPVGARVLKVVIDYDRLLTSGKTSVLAIECLKSQKDYYDPSILAAFLRCLETDDFEEDIVPVMALKTGMFLTENLYTKGNRLVLCKGQETTPSVCNQLATLLKNGAIEDNISVIIREEENTDENSG
jgi:response regulator RpfG family c-di-GMP phosphodiesterase